jgi:23S rRNA pseudouridine2605 synthase
MEEMILAGRITVNRMPAEVGQKVGPGDEVRINGEVVKVRFAEPRPRVLVYHKPAGELVTRDDPEGRPTVFEKLPSIGNGRWVNVGRLDYNTEGLLLFTNSGELANRLMHPRYEVEREYAVRIMGRLSDEQMQALTSGVELDDGPARCEKVSDGGGDEDGANHWYHVVLKEGRNREVRRLFEALGAMVSRLIRTRYGMIAMPTTVKRGQIAELESADVDALVASAGLRPNAGRPSQRPDPRGARNGKGKPPHAGPRRPAKGGKGARPPFPATRSGDDTRLTAGSGESPAPEGDAAHTTRPRGPKPAASQHAPRARAWKQRGGPARPQEGARGPARPQEGARGPHDDARRKPAHPHAQKHGQRPARPRHNFDEVQPHSNANAAPFGRTTLTVPGANPRGYGNEAAPRQRSGPRAHKAAQARGRTAGAEASYARLDDDAEAYRAPARPSGITTQVRTKRRRTELNGSAAAAAEANANAAPPEPPKGSDDER